MEQLRSLSLLCQLYSKSLKNCFPSLCYRFIFAYAVHRFYRIWFIYPYPLEISNDSLIKKPKRLTSVVWNRFEKAKTTDICYDVCVHCYKKLSGSINSRITHLRNQLIWCLKWFNHDVCQLLAAKRLKRTVQVVLETSALLKGREKMSLNRQLWNMIWIRERMK